MGDQGWQGLRAGWCGGGVVGVCFAYACVCGGGGGGGDAGIEDEGTCPGAACNDGP